MDDDDGDEEEAEATPEDPTNDEEANETVDEAEASEEVPPAKKQKAATKGASAKINGQNKNSFRGKARNASSQTTKAPESAQVGTRRSTRGK